MCFQGNITIFTRVSDLRECDADTDTLNNAAITVCLAADQMGKRHIIKDYKRLIKDFIYCFGLLKWLLY